MAGYILTFIAAIFRGILSYFMDGSATNASTNFGANIVNVITIAFAVVGVIVAFFQSKGLKGKLLSLVISAVIFVVGSLLVKAFVPVAIGIVVIGFVVIKFNLIGRFTGGSAEADVSDELPGIIYDGNDVRYDLVSSNDSWYVYRNTETNETVTIQKSNNVNGNSINSSAGWFHWN